MAREPVAVIACCALLRTTGRVITTAAWPSSLRLEGQYAHRPCSADARVPGGRDAEIATLPSPSSRCTSATAWPSLPSKFVPGRRRISQVNIDQAQLRLVVLQLHRYREHIRAARQIHLHLKGRPDLLLASSPGTDRASPVLGPPAAAYWQPQRAAAPSAVTGAAGAAGAPTITGAPEVCFNSAAAVSPSIRRSSIELLVPESISRRFSGSSISARTTCGITRNTISSS